MKPGAVQSVGEFVDVLEGFEEFFAGVVAFVVGDVAKWFLPRSEDLSVGEGCAGWS